MKAVTFLLRAAALACSATAVAGDLTVATDGFALTVGEDAVVKSLVLSANGAECARSDLRVPLFAVTQDRPFNNEIKLSEPTCRTTYPAVSLRAEGDRLVVGFRHRQYEAVVRVRCGKGYAAFELEDFRCDRAKTYDYLKMDVPPVAAFRVLQLPVRGRRHFGRWLNACWDETEAAVAVVGLSPHADAGAEARGADRILSADLFADIGLKGCGAAIVAAPGRERFLDAMDALEADFGLPRGVRSRRSPIVAEPIFHVCGKKTFENLDALVAAARRGGFRLMTFRDRDVAETRESWAVHGDYDWRADFPRNEAELAAALAKVKAAGLHPGLHTLHPHIGLQSRYVTPVADPRLNKTKRLTLAADLAADADPDELAVLEPDLGVPRFDACRVLQFGGELMTYERVTGTRPARFSGIRRGAFGTRRAAHVRGTVGGVLDVSEFGNPDSCYIDQNTDLQDEVAAKLARFYNCGFEYVYLDGSEGVNRPFYFHVANAQYRCWRLFRPEPLFGEAAAKSHFSWHMLGGANAFDCFEPEVFKAKTRAHPFAQAPRTWEDMTRIDFGWWYPYPPEGKGVGTQADMWEYGLALTAAWDGAVSILFGTDELAKHPRMDDLLETVRRWNDFRRRGLLSDDDRAKLRDADREHHLLVNAQGGYELVEIEMIPACGGTDADIRAFAFVRGGRACVAFWHVRGEGDFALGLPAERLRVARDADGAGAAPEADGGGARLHAAGRRYLVTDLPLAEVKRAFAAARAIPPTGGVAATNPIR